MPSFTTQVPNLQGTGPVLEVRLAVSEPLEEWLRERGQDIPPPVALTGMVDTGASGCVVQQGLPTQLGLQPVGTTLINTPSSTNVLCSVYAVRLVLAGGQVVVNGTVIEAPLQGQNIQCLVGRDILAHGVLIYIGYANQFTLSV